MKLKIPHVLIAGIALIVIASVAFGGHKPVCPEDFGTDDAGSAQYLAATDKWTNDFFDANPDATLKEWGEARHQFWVDNHCLATLKSYEEAKAGKVDPKTEKVVDDILRDATQP